MKLLQHDLSRLRDCRKRRDVGRITASISGAHGEVSVLGLKSIPHRICEEIFWQVVH